VRGAAECLYLREVARQPDAARVREAYGKLAPRHDRSVRFWGRLLRIEMGRRWVCSQAGGEVLEIGVGTGLNLPHYPQDVRLTGIDLIPAMLELARQRAQDLGREVDLRLGDAQALDFPDESFDTVVFGMCLCSIPDDRRAVAEAMRVLRPGGRVLLLEHVRSPTPLVRVGQRLVEPLFLRFQADHLLREPLENLKAEGFEIERVERWAWGVMEGVSASKPSGE
jgi:ubiquinone/menaquinone biosynthesis C-methylase UbiE